MNSVDIDPAKLGKRWVSYFDILGFADLVRNNDPVSIFCYLRACADELRWQVQESNHIEWMQFSDTFLVYTTDDTKASYCAIDEVSRSFVDELVVIGIPLRGAMAFGELYVDKTNGLLFGKALVDANKYGERFNWAGGFALYSTALTRMFEVGLPFNDRSLHYKKWNVELKKRKTFWSRKEDVVAYQIGPGSIMPLDGSHPYVESLEGMANGAESPRDKRKYRNIIELLKHYPNPKKSASWIERFRAGQ